MPCEGPCELCEQLEADLDQKALDVLQEVTTALYSVSMPIAQRHAKAQNAIRAALAAALRSQ